MANGHGAIEMAGVWLLYGSWWTFGLEGSLSCSGVVVQCFSVAHTRLRSSSAVPGVAEAEIDSAMSRQYALADLRTVFALVVTC